nr:MAG TPA: hypothetical protein [Crassvirales sp.]DAX32715.1 MAG TPA: hypothetical protein [Caudoviricetes sp.]
MQSYYRTTEQLLSLILPPLSIHGYLLYGSSLL